VPEKTLQDYRNRITRESLKRLGRNVERVFQIELNRFKEDGCGSRRQLDENKWPVAYDLLGVTGISLQ